MPAIYALSMHASYRCQERGPCCTAGWPIPVEAECVAHLQRVAPRWLALMQKPRGTDDQASDPMFLPLHGNTCAFHSPTLSKRCHLHAKLGHSALPLACRQFPRVSVSDPRGTSVTLSHYCPTAADLLAGTTELSIAQNPPAFPASGEYIGLDAHNHLPPLLTPSMLMDWEAWWGLEDEAVALIAGSRDPGEALTRVRTLV